MILQAATPPRPRKKTRPTRASHRKRLEAKKRRAATKKARGKPVLE
jgi:ribosome-associated protein